MAFTQTGARKWTFPINGNAGQPTLSSDGTIYVPYSAGSTLGTVLLALSQDGNQLWSFNGGSGLMEPVALGLDGTIYFGVVFKLYALNPNGTTKWTLDFMDHVHYPEVGPDGTIYVGSDPDSTIRPNSSRPWGR